MKKCKGTGKATGYGCGEPNEHRKYGLGIKCGCYQKWLLTSEEGKKIISKNILRSKRTTIQNKKKERREFKQKHKSIQALIKEARIPFQKYIRMRDANYGCISCGTTTSEIYDAGHLYKAELYSGLIFDEENCNKQCRKCNTYLNGNEGEYRKGFIQRYSAEQLLDLDERARLYKSKKYTREELIGIKKLYNFKIKNYE